MNYEKVCSKCIHSKWNEEYKSTVPSIHTCFNEESESYNSLMAWCSTCDKWEKK